MLPLSVHNQELIGGADMFLYLIRFFAFSEGCRPMLPLFHKLLSHFFEVSSETVEVIRCGCTRLLNGRDKLLCVLRCGSPEIRHTRVGVIEDELVRLPCFQQRQPEGGAAGEQFHEDIQSSIVKAFVERVYGLRLPSRVSEWG